MSRYFAVIVFAFVFVFFIPSGWSAEEREPSENTLDHRDWHFFANISYTSRTLDGSVAETSEITDDVFGNLYATDDSMNLGNSDKFMYTLASSAPLTQYVNTNKYQTWTVNIIIL